jgi:cell division protease FtsH
VDEEIRKVVMSGYDQAKQIIEKNRHAVELMAKELLEVESLEADELKALLARAGASLN